MSPWNAAVLLNFSREVLVGGFLCCRCCCLGFFVAFPHQWFMFTLNTLQFSLLCLPVCLLYFLCLYLLCLYCHWSILCKCLDPLYTYLHLGWLWRLKRAKVCTHTSVFPPGCVCVRVFNFYLLSHLNVTCCAILCHNIMDTVMPCSSCSSGRTSFTLSGGACLAKSWCL